MIRKIELNNFRLFDSKLIETNNSLVILSGKNATGKTSILESIYLTSTTKSHRTSDIDTLIKENKEYILYFSGELFNTNLNNIKNLFENDSQKICFDAKCLMHELNHYGIELNNYFDVSIAMYIANEMDAEIIFEDALKLNQISHNIP